MSCGVCDRIRYIEIEGECEMRKFGDIISGLDLLLFIPMLQRAISKEFGKQVYRIEDNKIPQHMWITLSSVPRGVEDDFAHDNLQFSFVFEIKSAGGVEIGMRLDLMNLDLMNSVHLMRRRLADGRWEIDHLDDSGARQVVEKMREVMDFSMMDDEDVAEKCLGLASQEFQMRVVRKDPDMVQRIVAPPLEVQRAAIKVGGKRILLLIKHLDPTLRDEYASIVNLKRSGLFR